MVEGFHICSRPRRFLLLLLLLRRRRRVPRPPRLCLHPRIFILRHRRRPLCPSSTSFSSSFSSSSFSSSSFASSFLSSFHMLLNQQTPQKTAPITSLIDCTRTDPLHSPCSVHNIIPVDWLLLPHQLRKHTQHRHTLPFSSS